MDRRDNSERRLVANVPVRLGRRLPGDGRPPIETNQKSPLNRVQGGAALPVQPIGSSARSVLIVDPSDDVRMVLRTALARTGTRIFEARGATDGVRLAQCCHPDLIVLDGETPHGDDDWKELNAAAHQRSTPLVVLGSARLHGDALPSGEFVDKPYHYAPLIRRIEGLLAGPTT
jgi:CheY-like chemotaxis protein